MCVMETAHARHAVGTPAAKSLLPRPARTNLLSWRAAPFFAPGQPARRPPSSGHRTAQLQQARRQPSSVQVRALLKNLGSIFSADPAEKTRKKYEARVAQINALEHQLQHLSSEALRAKTEDFKRRVQKGESLDSLLVEAFAVRASLVVPGVCYCQNLPGCT